MLENKDIEIIRSIVVEATEGVKKDLERKIENLEHKVEKVEHKIEKVQSDLEGKIGGVQENLENVQRNLQEEIQKIHMLLENTTNRNIKIIAEGHTDLCRKLDEAMKAENERELLLVRLNFLEEEVRQIKDQLKRIA